MLPGASNNSPFKRISANPHGSGGVKGSIGGDTLSRLDSNQVTGLGDHGGGARISTDPKLIPEDVIQE